MAGGDLSKAVSVSQNDTQWNELMKEEAKRREAQAREAQWREIEELVREAQRRKVAMEAFFQQKRQEAEEIVSRKIDSGWKPASKGFRDKAKDDPTFSWELKDPKNRVFGRIVDCKIETPSNRIDFPEKSRLVVKYFNGMFKVKIGDQKYSTVDGNTIEVTEEIVAEVKRRALVIDNLWEIRINHYKGKKNLDHGVLGIRSFEPRVEIWEFVAKLDCSPQSFK